MVWFSLYVTMLAARSEWHVTRRCELQPELSESSPKDGGDMERTGQPTHPFVAQHPIRLVTNRLWTLCHTVAAAAVDVPVARGALVRGWPEFSVECYA
ncbi:hypothetical protein [Ottowia sp.]|uniref:hypothetical protein n=1 Tax=Ottowia sp. TaxID=1898956 RepID=UPI002CA61536|nr:hypothetical protein [Ottowia sp.]